MNVGSLFSGIGGIELGFERAGFKTEWFIEKDLYCRTVIRKHWPEAVIYDDVTKVDFRTIPKVDVLTGGFPCQDISNAGTRVGIKGSRSSLWKYYYEAIRQIRPKYALIENVAALAYRGLNVVLADLAEIGYDAEWYNISASSVGALHRRERLFIIAYPSNANNNNREQCKEGVCKKINDVSYNNRERCEEQCGTISNETTQFGTKLYRDASDSEGIGLDRGLRANREDREGIQVGEEEEQLVFRGETTGCSTPRGEVTNWSTESGVGRVAYGIPNRIHRIKCLGNSVVPQCAEVFARAIKERGDLNEEV